MANQNYITNNSLVNLSPEDQARANAEALKVNQAVKQVTEKPILILIFSPGQNYITSAMEKDSLTAIQIITFGFRH